MNTLQQRSAGTRLAVRFLRTWQNYMPGDTASFPPQIARGLVARRTAEAVNVRTEGEPPPEGPWAVRVPLHVVKSL
jgi:hypothetical protein